MENGTPAAWIPDGYTRSAYLETIRNLYPEVRFTFRPLLVMQQAVINREIRQAGEDLKKHQMIAATWMTQQIVDWDIKKPDGDLVDHRDVSQVIRLQPALFTRIWDIVNGSDGGDVDEAKTPYEMHSAAQRELAIANSGKGAEEFEEGN